MRMQLGWGVVEILKGFILYDGAGSRGLAIPAL